MPRHRFSITILCVMTTLVLSASNALCAERLRIKLHWIAHAEFAGIFIAKEKGWYAKEGIDLQILPRDVNDDDIANGLLNNKYDIAMDIGSVVINSRARKNPVRAFAAKFQSSPLGLLSMKDSGIERVEDLKGKVIGFYVLSDLWILETMLHHAGLTLQDVLLRKISMHYDELSAGNVDALFAFEMMEPVIMKLKGLETNFLKSEDNGFASYGSVYFAKDEYIKKHRNLLAKFLKATFKGWKYVFEHPDEATELVMKRYFPEELYVNGDKEMTTRLQRLYCRLIRRYMVKGTGPYAMGYMNSVIWKKTIDQMRNTKVLAGDVAANHVYTLDVLEDLDKLQNSQ